jgi:hypothetical protein
MNLSIFNLTDKKYKQRYINNKQTIEEPKE